MARKRASLKGKGTSILLGEERTGDSSPPPTIVAEMPPEAGEGALPETYSPEEEAADRPATLEDEVAAAEPPPEAEEPKEVDWSAMLEDEVTTAVPPAEEVITPSVPAIEYYYPEEEPTVPEPELPAIGEIEEAAIIEPSPAPTVPVALPTPPPSPAATQLPPSVPTSPPLVRIGGLLAGVSLPDMEKLAPPGPGFEEVKIRETTKAPPRELTDEEEETVIGRVSRKDRRELNDRISQLYRDVAIKLGTAGLQSKRDETFLLLSEARDIVLEDPRQFDEAEHKVGIVEATIAQTENVAKWSGVYGSRLVAYLVVWFVLLMGAVFFYNPIAVWLERATAGTPAQTLPIQLSSLAFTMLWGSLGGVLGGLYSLWKYVAEKQIFDKQYTIWYALQPISGLLIGAMVHALVMTGFVSMFNQVTEGGAPATLDSQAGFWFPAIIALALGFRQNFALRFLDRVIELIGGEK